MSAAWWVVFWLLWSAVGGQWLMTLDVQRFNEAHYLIKSLCLVAAGPVVWAAVLAALVWVSS